MSCCTSCCCYCWWRWWLELMPKNGLTKERESGEWRRVYQPHEPQLLFAASERFRTRARTHKKPLCLLVLVHQTTVCSERVNWQQQQQQQQQHQCIIEGWRTFLRCFSFSSRFFLSTLLSARASSSASSTHTLTNAA